MTRALLGLSAAAWLATVGFSAWVMPGRIDRSLQRGLDQDLADAGLGRLLVEVADFEVRVSGPIDHPLQEAKVRDLLERHSDLDLGITLDLALPAPEPEPEPRVVAPQPNYRFSKSREGGIRVQGTVPKASDGDAIVAVLEGATGLRAEDVAWDTVGSAVLPSLEQVAVVGSCLEALSDGAVVWSDNGIEVMGRASTPASIAVAQQLLATLEAGGVPVEIRVSWDAGARGWLSATRDGYVTRVTGLARDASRLSALFDDGVAFHAVDGGVSRDGFGDALVAAVPLVDAGALQLVERSGELTVSGFHPPDGRDALVTSVTSAADGTEVAFEKTREAERCPPEPSAWGRFDPASAEDVDALRTQILGCPNAGIELPGALGAPSPERAVSVARWLWNLALVGVDPARLVSWDDAGAFSEGAR